MSPLAIFVVKLYPINQSINQRLKHLTAFLKTITLFRIKSRKVTDHGSLGGTFDLFVNIYLLLLITYLLLVFFSYYILLKELAYSVQITSK